MTMMSLSVPRTVALLLMCTALIAAQTFQYSRGWTNGRKRGGMMLMARQPGSVGANGLAPLLDTRAGQRAAAAATAAAAALLEDAGLLFPGALSPCQHDPAVPGPLMPATAEGMQRFRAILESRALPLTPSQEDSVVERRRRDAEASVTAAPPAAN